MQELLEELLTRYRWMDRGVQSTDLRDLVISAVRKIAFVAECQSVQIVQNVPERMMIAADRQRIQRVFVNLFVNALDVMPNGGAIRISAIRKGHSVLIKVRDTGREFVLKFVTGSFNLSRPPARRTGSGSVLPSHGRPLSMTADRSGWSRMALEPASRSSSRHHDVTA